MKSRYLFFLLLSVAYGAYGQAKADSVTVHYKTFKDYNDLRLQQKSDHIVSVCCVDSVLGYKVIVPDWLNLRETGSDFMFGGTLPAVNGVENVILIKAFPKKDYADMAAFENYVIGNWAFGTHPKWSNQHVCYGLTKLEPYPGLGKVYRVSTFYMNKIYTCKYVLAETKTAFLWIDFTSTPTLYDINEKKFEEFLKGLKFI